MSWDAEHMAKLRVSAHRTMSGRAAVKRELRTGRRRLSAVLTNPPAVLDGMQIGALLEALPRVGRTKAMRILGRAGISATRQIGSLTDRERRAILTTVVHLHPVLARTAV